MKKNLFLLSLLMLCSAIGFSQDRLSQAVSQFSKTNSNLTQNDLKEVVEKDGHVSSLSNIHHSYYSQKHNGIEIFGSTASLHTDKTGKVVKTNNNLTPNVSGKVSGTTPSLTPIQAVQAMAVEMGYGTVGNITNVSGNQAKTKDQQVVLSPGNISLENIPAKLMYYPLQTGALQLVWEMTIHEHSQDNVWQMFVDASTGEIVDKFNMVVHCNFGDHDHSHDHANHTHSVEIKKAKKSGLDFEGILSHSPGKNGSVGGYMVFAMPIESPYFGQRTMENDPEDLTYSPYGWHDTNGQPGSEFTDTRGNNVDAYEDGNNQGHRASGGASLQFNFPWNINYSTSNQSEDAAITNLFYWNNIIHDVLCHLGFDAPAGNFQKNNYGQSGSANDDVRAEAQDGSGTCNANMLTLPDGQRPRMQMYTCGSKDGDFDNLVIVHEYGHGISKRLTGGRTNTSCLTSQEQQGEGISDFYGLMLTMDASNSPTSGRTVGTYLFDQGPNGAGIRPKPYNTAMSGSGSNNATYNTIKTMAVPHGVGYVWCTMLWEMTWEIMAITPFDPDFYQGTGGNNVAMKLVTEGLKLQPCQPGFVDARDAILDADVALYNGAYKCAIWTAFAKRGLGQNANQGSVNSKTDGTENFTVPSNACTGGPACTVSVSPSSVSEGATGGSNTVQVTATSGQSWTASTTASWITVNTTSGTGSGSLNFTVANNSGSARTGTITITCGANTATVTVNQAGAGGGNCNIVVNPTSFSIPATGGNGSPSVSATAGQSWTASTTNSWITVIGGSGTGSGSFSFTVAANSGSARTGTISVSCGTSSSTVTINQAGTSNTCNISVSPSSNNVTAAAGSGVFQVTTAQQWSTNTTATWVTLSPSSGSGNAAVTYNYQANTGPARSAVVNIFCPGTVTPVASFTLNQAGGVINTCLQQYTTLPYTTGFEQGQLDQYWCTHTENASGRVQVTNQQGPNSGTYHLTMDCSTSSTFSTNDATLGLDLTGQSNVRLRFAWREYQEEDHPEDGVFFSDDGGQNYRKAYDFQIGPQTYTVVDLNIDSMATALGLSLTNRFIVKFQQRDNFPMTTDGIAIDDVSVKSTPVGCNISVNPTNVLVPAAGVTNAQVTVTGTGNWTATTANSWITVTNGTGSGSGTFNYTVAANTGLPRNGTINVSCGSQNIQVTIAQAGINPTCLQQYSAIPYSTGFENGLDQFWCTDSENQYGDIMVSSANTPNNGTKHLTMAVTTSGNYCTNEATLGLRLAGQSNVTLSFYYKEFTDESDLEDGIFFSDDGGSTYVNVYALHNNNGSYQQVTLDVDALAQANGLQLTNTFVVKFQQRDNYTIPTDGMAFDDVSVTTTQNCNLTVTPTFHNIPATGGTVQSTITSTGTWQAAANGTWITISPTTGSSGTTTMNITVPANTSPLGRIGQIIIKCPTNTSDTIRIIQPGVALGCTQQYATPPYSTGFENGLDANWCTYSSSAQYGRIQVTSLHGPNNGTNHMTMDVTTNGNINRNEAHLGLNLAGVQDAVISFWWKEFSDENNYEDGIFFSDDGGTTFIKAYDLINGTSTYQNIVIDIDSIAAYLGLNLTSTFIIKFQQYDNYSIATDGFAFDDIEVKAGSFCNLTHPPLVYAPSYASSVSVPVTGGNWMASETSGTPSWMWLIDSTGGSGDLVKVGMFYNNSQNQRTGSIQLACTSGSGSSTMTITQGGYPNFSKSTNPNINPFGGDTNNDGIVIEYYEEAPGLSFLNNRPNPFDQSTTIEFILENAANVSLMVTDITGKVVAEPIVNETRDAGQHDVLFSAKDLAPGVYMYTLETNGFRTTKQMVIAR